MKIFDFMKERYDEHNIERRFSAALNTISKLQGLSEYETDAFQFVSRNANVVHLRFEEAKKRIRNAEIRQSLFSFAEDIIENGKNQLLKKNFLAEIDRFDESAILTPAEFLSVGDIIVLECSKVFLYHMEKALDIQTSINSAESWIEKDIKIPSDADLVFFLEHALRLSKEKEALHKRKALVDLLNSIGKTEDEIVKAACDKVSDLVLRMTNVVLTIHMAIDVDWMDAFQKISHIEKTLMNDPSGIYPNMDDESKAAIRREIEVIQKYTHIPQRHITSVALSLSDASSNGITEILYTDNGRKKLLESLNVENEHLPKIIPDPKGHRMIISVFAVMIALCAFIAICFRPMDLIILFPCIFSLSEDIVRRISAKRVSTRPLLSLKTDSVSDENRTLVVIPALLASEKSVENALYNLESYGAHEKSENIDFLLLGDFKDSKTSEMETDKDIIKKIKENVLAINARCEREKYFYLIRERTFNETDQIYMGYERKRGALMDLSRLLKGYANRFSSESSDVYKLIDQYRYVVTIDMDTKILPGTIRKMISTIAHPLNHEYAVLQPRMENAGLEKINLFSEFMAGFGGTDHYDVCSADFYQDLTGEGLFSGKGIYNVKAFYDRTSEAFMENTVLSHDMIEGILAKAAYCGNIVMYESFPETSEAYLKRLDRWTRGDWQLILYLFGRIRLNSIGRYKILGNLFRSLKAASLLLGIILSVWTGRTGLLIALLVYAFMPVLLDGFASFKPCISSFFLLPITAYTQIKAAITALVRIYITKHKRLEWVTAAESERTGKTYNYPGIYAAIFMIPGLFSLSLLIPSLLIALSFAFGKDVFVFFDRFFRNEDIPAASYTYLMDLAKRMWRYFEKHVPLTGSGFPPDNVQIDPPIGEQSRTSPTNIGMYLISIIGARELGLIEESELLARIRQTHSSLQKIETWNGLPYNWYDIYTLKPATPKYVSSVDAGNLMAAYVTVRNYLKNVDHILSGAFDELIQKMDIEKLYNSKRKLFRIGIDVQNNQMSASYYDLFSSEARILSYTAMAEKGIPISHWKHLARPFFFHKGKSALLSWSGTMFEYMMPNLLMPSCRGSLMQISMKSAIDLQTKKAQDGIWGISEAGYAAFDQMLNYQYKAFGISRLALSGETTQTVYAPYALLIALEHAFSKGMDALKIMQEAGLKGEYGFYEAIDYSIGNRPRIVYSYMSHHQGMGFAAICNLLTENSLRRHFLNHPLEQALTPLLNEKPFIMPAYKRWFHRENTDSFKKNAICYKSNDYERIASGLQAEGHLLFTGDTTAYFENTGRSFLKKDQIYANLFSYDLKDMRSTLLPEIMDATGISALTRCRFDTGTAIYDFASKAAKYRVSCTLNPINSDLVIQVSAENKLDIELQIQIRHKVRISLNTEDMNYAHPVFSDLFINTSELDNRGYEYARKNRDTLEFSDYLYHLTDDAADDIEDNQKQYGKYSILTRNIKLSPHGKKELFFLIGIDTKKRTSFEKLDANVFHRSQTLLKGQMNAHIQFCNLSASEYRMADKTAIGLFSLKAREGKGQVDKSSLWPLGLSGEKGILLLNLKSTGDLILMKKAVRMHEFLKYAGVPLTIVILKVRETEYFTPLKDAANHILMSGHLAGWIGIEDGAIMLDASDLTFAQSAALASINILNESNPEKLSLKKGKKPIEYAKIYEAPEKNELIGFNGYGGFLKNSNAYEISIKRDLIPPRRWSNFISNDFMGALVNDLGVSSIYYSNSRMGRITAFDNDLDSPKERFKINITCNGKTIPLFPGNMPAGSYTVIHDTGRSVYRVKAESVFAETTLFLHPEKPILFACASINNQSEEEISLYLDATIDFLMGTDERDLKYTAFHSLEACTMAIGCARCVACAGFIDGDISENGMRSDIVLKPFEKRTISFLIVASENEDKAYELFRSRFTEEANQLSGEYWNTRLNAITVSTGDPVRDKLSNGFMKYQTLASRYFARFGPYQPGGAFGMRDQLQDMMSIIYFDRSIVRKHILLSASRQFENGDGLHWWHMPASGVRTKISDDILFLAVVTAKYAEESGDYDVLKVKIPYLKNQEIPEGESDLYASFEETDYSEALYEHIMKAFRYTCKRGLHGLLLMGTGDWNDGMNRVGEDGRGESVWLSMFWIYAANAFAVHARQKDKEYLLKTSDELRKAIEEHAWDGEWYLRAFYDDGRKLGSAENAECRIDLISQVWAVLADLDKERAEAALESVEKHLINEETGIVRLLTPPFTGIDGNPGYISAYPPGTRENGGQYTHAVTWLVKAYAKLGQAEKAWNTFDMILPINRTDSFEKAYVYGGEPYVIAADISDREKTKGECGWTWYTGAAAWATRVLYEDLLGLEIKKDKVRIKPLLKESMNEVRITIQKGGSKYVLIGRRNPNAQDDTITMIDDGKEHVHFFSARN